MRASRHLTGALCTVAWIGRAFVDGPVALYGTIIYVGCFIYSMAWLGSLIGNLVIRRQGPAVAPREDPILNPGTQPPPPPWPLTEAWLEQQVGRLPSIDGYSADIDRQLNEVEWAMLTEAPRVRGARGPHPRPTIERRRRAQA